MSARRSEPPPRARRGPPLPGPRQEKPINEVLRVSLERQTGGFTASSRETPAGRNGCAAPDVQRPRIGIRPLLEFRVERHARRRVISDSVGRAGAGGLPLAERQTPLSPPPFAQKRSRRGFFLPPDRGGLLARRESQESLRASSFGLSARMPIPSSEARRALPGGARREGKSRPVYVARNRGRGRASSAPRRPGGLRGFLVGLHGPRDLLRACARPEFPPGGAVVGISFRDQWILLGAGCCRGSPVGRRLPRLDRPKFLPRGDQNRKQLQGSLRLQDTILPEVAMTIPAVPVKVTIDEATSEDATSTSRTSCTTPPSSFWISAGWSREGRTSRSSCAP